MERFSIQSMVFHHTIMMVYYHLFGSICMICHGPVLSPVLSAVPCPVLSCPSCPVLCPVLSCPLSCTLSCHVVIHSPQKKFNCIRFWHAMVTPICDLPLSLAVDTPPMVLTYLVREITDSLTISIVFVSTYRAFFKVQGRKLRHEATTLSLKHKAQARGFKPKP